MRNTADANPPYLVLAKSRSAALGGNVILVNEDKLGEIRFGGSDGVDMANFGAEIRAEVDGTPAADSIPGALVFSTSPGGSQVEALRIDHSGNVGIGTNNPGNSLHVYNNSTQASPNSSHSPTGAVLQVQDNSNSLYIDGNSIIGTGAGTLHVGNASNAAMNLWTNGVNRIHIEADGNVGIGSNDPHSELDVFSDTFSDITISSARTSGNIGGINFRKDAGGSSPAVMGQVYVTTAGEYIIKAGGADASNEAIRIEADGNVGIGTNNPGSKLEVNGVVRIHERTANIPARLAFKSAASNQVPTARIEFWEGNSVGSSTDAHAAIEYDGGTTYGGDGAILIKGYTSSADQVMAGFSRSGETFFTGNVGIGTIDPSQKLHVVGNVQINGGVLTSLLTTVIADDAYLDVVMPVKGGIIAITSFTTYDTYPQPNGTGLVYYDAGTSKNASVMVDASNTLATSTDTSTTVGTFTDGKTTIAMVNSTGTIRIWNRMNSARQYKITLL
jgi:hypothetical protein